MNLRNKIMFVCGVLLTVGAGSATAQSSTGQTSGLSKPAVNKTAKLSDVFAQINEQEPIRRAGLRAGLIRQTQIIVPIVLIVDDADSYLYAISNWEGPVRFPVLWDDSTSQSHEDIARFVRGFNPEHVLKLGAAPGNGSVDKWVGNREKKQEIFEQVLGRALDEKSMDWRGSLRSLNDSGVVSPGIVVTDVLDRAWPAALALSAGRFQPISFVTKAKSSVYQPMSPKDADGLERAIERAAMRTGNQWAGIGDDIDAITLAINTGTMIKTGNGARDRIATTDRIGRSESNGSGQRWAYCGQIIGNESRSVYQAMCSLFLTIDQGFVWDGYSNEQPWALYDGSEAAGVFERAGLSVELHDIPRNTMGDWKQRMVRPVGNRPGEDDLDGSAAIMLMNSKGASNVFDLPGVVDGTGKPGHVPIFDVPVALHVVHSFSLAIPLNRNTFGGRLIERGVFVYAGSVDEPYLQAFVPTPAIARRLVSSLSFAAAVRFDDGDVWKITVLGDPLFTFGPAGRRSEGTLNVPGAVVLDERYKSLLKDGDFQGAIEDLALIGRDADAARIAKALINDKPEFFTAGVARASIPSLFRAGEFGAMLESYDRLDALGRVDPLMQDLLWLSSPYLLARSSGDSSARGKLVALLRANIRSNQKIQDAEDLAMFMRKRSLQDAIGVLEALRPTLTENQGKMLDRAIRRVRK